MVLSSRYPKRYWEKVSHQLYIKLSKGLRQEYDILRYFCSSQKSFQRGLVCLLCVHDSRSLQCWGYRAHISRLQQCSKHSRGVIIHPGWNNYVLLSPNLSPAPYVEGYQREQTSIRWKADIVYRRFSANPCSSSVSLQSCDFQCKCEVIF